jgi:hypothetical protein
MLHPSRATGFRLARTHGVQCEECGRVTDRTLRRPLPSRDGGEGRACMRCVHWIDDSIARWSRQVDRAVRGWSS